MCIQFSACNRLSRTVKVGATKENTSSKLPQNIVVGVRGVGSFVNYCEDNCTLHGNIAP